MFANDITTKHQRLRINRGRPVIIIRLITIIIENIIIKVSVTQTSCPADLGSDFKLNMNLVTDAFKYILYVSECVNPPQSACVHSRSHFLILRSDAGFSFESGAHNDISFRQHTSRRYGTTQRHFWPRKRGWGDILETFIGEVSTLLLFYAHPLHPPPSWFVFVQPPALFSRSSNSFCDSSAPVLALLL